MDFAHTPSNLPGKGRSPFSSPSPKPLTYGDTYLCPVCRHGCIEQMALMDSFACSFCRHIFDVNLPQQTVQVVDSSQPMAWQWNGKAWKSQYDLDESLTIFLWLISIFLILVPVAIIGISAYVFPPMPNTRWVWLPTVWASCTFLSHFLMVSWLMAEHYQFSFYVLSKLRIQRWLNR